MTLATTQQHDIQTKSARAGNASRLVSVTKRQLGPKRKEPDVSFSHRLEPRARRLVS